jgi:hypothetical protein
MVSEPHTSHECKSCEVLVDLNPRIDRVVAHTTAATPAATGTPNQPRSKSAGHRTRMNTAEPGEKSLVHELGGIRHGTNRTPPR